MVDVKREVLPAIGFIVALLAVIHFSGVLSFGSATHQWWMVSEECSYNGDASFTCNSVNSVQGTELLGYTYISSGWSQELGENPAVVKALRDTGAELTSFSDGTVSGFKNPDKIGGTCTVYWTGTDDDGSFTGSISAVLKGNVTGGTRLPCRVASVKSISYSGDYTRYEGTTHLEIENGGDFRIRYDLRRESIVSDDETGGTGTVSTGTGFLQKLNDWVLRFLNSLGVSV